MRTLCSLAVVFSLLTGCRDAPETTTLPDPPAGLAVSWAFDDCAPWDGAATTIYLAQAMPSEPRTAPYPFAWVSLYRPAMDLAGRTFRWDTDDKNTGGAMWCEDGRPCVAATNAVVRIRQQEGTEAGIAGTVDLTFPGGLKVTGGFYAVWMTNELLCG